MPKSKQRVRNEKLRVVLDTNVLVSGLITPLGTTGTLLELLSGNIDSISILTTDEILVEYENVLNRPRFGFEAETVRAILNFIRHHSFHLYPSPVRNYPSSTDPHDNKFIACAFNGEAHYLITGNERHFSGLSLGRTKVVTPGSFLKVIFHVQG